MSTRFLYCALISVLLSFEALAADVTFFYRGTLNSVLDAEPNNVVSTRFDASVTHDFTLSFTFDPDDPNPNFPATDQDPNPDTGEYLNVVKSMVFETGDFRIEGQRGAAPGEGLVGDILLADNVARDGTTEFIDEFVIFLSGLDSELGEAMVIIDLVSAHGTGTEGPPLTGDTLPTGTVATGTWLHPNTFFTVDFLDGDGEFIGSIASLSDGDGLPGFDAAVVPLPPAIILFVGAITVLFAAAPRPKKAARP